MIGKRKCKMCGNYTRRWVTHPIGTFCNHAHAQLWASAKREKLRAKSEADRKRKQAQVKREARKGLKEFNRRDLRWQHKQTQKAFNKMRVRQEIRWFKDRGLEPECISCGKTNMDWCCSHLKTVGSQGALRYDENNTKLGCNRYCNMGLSGNINGNKNTRGYLVGLSERFGPDRAAEIIEYCEKDRVASWSWEELEQFRAECNVEIRRLEKELAL